MLTEPIYDEAGALMGMTRKEVAQALGITTDLLAQRMERRRGSWVYIEPVQRTSNGDPIYDEQGNYLGESLQEVANIYGVSRQAVALRIERKDGYRVLRPRQHPGPSHMRRKYRKIYVIEAKQQGEQLLWGATIEHPSGALSSIGAEYETMGQVFKQARALIDMELGGRR